MIGGKPYSKAAGRVCQGRIFRKNSSGGTTFRGISFFIAEGEPAVAVCLVIEKL